MAEIAENAGERLKAKVGPLPVWGWALLIGGSILLYTWYRKKKSGSSSDTSSTDTTSETTPSDADIGAGIIAADYDLRNSLNATNSQVANLASGVNALTPAIKADLKEDKDSDDKTRNYAVLSYGGHEYELGRESGTEITKKQQKEAHVTTPEKGAQFVQLRWAPKNYFQLGQNVPKHLTEEEFRKMKGHPKATVVSSNTHVNVAPSRIR